MIVAGDRRFRATFAARPWPPYQRLRKARLDLNESWVSHLSYHLFVLLELPLGALSTLTIMTDQ